MGLQLVEKTAMMGEWKRELAEARRRCKARVIGLSLVEQVQHGRLVRAVMEAFGEDPAATLYMEGTAAQGEIPRPDLILLHREVGVLVIENKGVAYEQVHAVRGTLLTLVRDGVLKEEDPFRQAEEVMFRLKDLCKQRCDLGEVLFLRTAAFPRIRRSEIEQRFGVHFPGETLFSDAVADPRILRAQVLEYAKRGQAAAGKSKRLTKRAHDAAVVVLEGKGLFYTPRKTFIESGDARQLGVQIQELELASKEATAQQKELGKSDLRGAHRLFRGVAGSGKSIMLALNTAQTLLGMVTEQAGLFEKRRKGRILVCCYNRTLVPYLRSKIEDRYGRIAWDAVPAEMLMVSHFEGLVREVEKQPGMASKLTYEEKEERARELCARFDRLTPEKREALLFDAVYVDEAQDLLPSELEFLRRLAREEGGKQTLVIFYDNAQNIYGVAQPTWSELGINIVGRTTYMDSCLRNTEEVLTLGFNVLVGSFAAAGERATTRQFAETADLKKRGLVTEEGGHFQIKFAQRRGRPAEVKVFDNRRAEAEGVAAEVRRMVEKEKVLPSDMLVLYMSHWPYKAWLEGALKEAVGARSGLRVVNSEHRENKDDLLMEEGKLTVSTIASAKGYDAPVVFVLGADLLPPDDEGRALFYVAATRAKLELRVSGVEREEAGLLGEIVRTAGKLWGERAVAREAAAEREVKASPVEGRAEARTPLQLVRSKGGVKKAVCRHCGSGRLHAQYGRFGYFFRCIDCTENTPIDKRCLVCGKEGRVRKAGLDFYLDCEGCGSTVVVHRNVSLETL